MKLPPFLLVLCFGVSALAQQPAPTPKKDPFATFGKTSLDRPQPGKAAPNPAGTGGSGSSLNQRPTSERIARPNETQSSLPVNTFSGLNFEAKTVTSGGRSTVDRNSSAFSAKETKTQESQPTIELNVRNVSHQPNAAQFEWYFVAKAVSGGTPYVWDEGRREVQVPASGAQVETLESKPLTRETVRESHQEIEKRTTITQHGFGGTGMTSTTTRYVPTVNSRQEQTGSQPFGWIVRMFVGETLVKVQASSSQLEVVGRDETQLKALLRRQATR